MGGQDDEGARLTSFPPIPEAGLWTVLANWSGRGSLFEALSAPQGDFESRQWTAADVRRRANRVLLASIEPAVSRWPRRVGEWIDFLPASKSRRRIVMPVPFSGVAWGESRRQFGWPPSAFTGKDSQRGADMLAVQVLRWCADKLSEIWGDFQILSPEQVLATTRQLDAIQELLNREPLASATGVMPSRTDLTALRREGAPWGSVATVAHELVEAQHSFDHLLYKLLMPDDEIRWRLFHLAVLGTVLDALRSAGCQLDSLRPLSATSRIPNYHVTHADGRDVLAMV